jgi:hypothetical protein
MNEAKRELGIKRRGQKPGTEIKGLVTALPESRDPAAAPRLHA